MLTGVSVGRLLTAGGANGSVFGANMQVTLHSSDKYDFNVLVEIIMISRH